jgi:hypothetical protein
MAGVTWTGLDALRTALQNLPDHLAQEAGTIVRQAAEDARATMATAYETHQVTGNLARGLKRMEQASGRYGVAVQIRNTSPHAWMVENGTDARHTSRGFNRGRMPPFHVMVPTAQRARAQMYRDLKAMLVDQGLLVTGDAP